MTQDIVFSALDGIDQEKYIVSTYYLETEPTAEVLSIAKDIAVGQTTGTWVPVPEETDEIRERHVGRVVGVYETPHYEREVPGDICKRHFILQIAIPCVNLDPQIPMLLSTIAGNDVTITYRLKLLDVSLPGSFVKAFGGPKFGIPGIRKTLNVADRPLIVNMIKPCIGISPKVGAELFYQAALGGADVIKDDEVLANTSYSPIVERVRAFMEKERQAFEETGEHTLYAVNITDRVEKIREHAVRVVEAGGNCLMLNFLPAGISTLSMLAEDPSIQVPILVHLDLSGAFISASNSGISAPLVLGKIPRLCGADMVIYPSPYGKFLFLKESYLRVAHLLRTPFHHIRPVFPAPSGGVHAGNLAPLIRDLGADCMIGVGGGIHGHRMGAKAGARSVRQAIDAILRGIPLEEEAKRHPELTAALEDWGVSGK
jgi:2,3-diketo-5-methylthiopentyl-1-phosphate enolase